MTKPPLVAVVGNPNAGKSALFNALTGARQKVGNYPGVTVERHVGRTVLPVGPRIELIDLPGTYSLDPASPDEAVTRDVLLGRQQGERLPDALLIVVDASNLDNHLRFALATDRRSASRRWSRSTWSTSPRRDGLELDPAATCPPRSASRSSRPSRSASAASRTCCTMLEDELGHQRAIARQRPASRRNRSTCTARRARSRLPRSSAKPRCAAGRTASIGVFSIRSPDQSSSPPILFVMFQAVFAWSAVPADALEAGIVALGQAIGNVMPSGLRSAR